MKLQSLAIRQALKANEISVAVNLFLDYFGLPPFTRKPVVNHPNVMPDTPSITGYHGSFVYTWDSQSGFMTNWDPDIRAARKYAGKPRDLHTIVIRTYF